ncbi:hypothetical protein CYMTET_17659 [Cymbomonas tetramitiformis]|nr:hypothetical protein CYMTET_17659 [Cymbomonas tetramitiformis]
MGGGIYTSNGTVNEKEPCIFRENVAEEMGGAVAALSGRVVLVGSTIEGNSAPSGGGVWAGNHSALSLTSATLRGNQAGADGGAAYVASHVGEFALHDCLVDDNNASEFGGAAFLQRPSTAATLTLRSTHFSANRAGAAGANLYWEQYADAPWPTCENCTAGSVEGVDNPEVDPILATDATDFRLVQGGFVVGATMKGESRVAFDPPLQYVAVDVYGNPTWLPSEPLVVAAVEDLEVSLSGSTLASYVPSEGATFTYLMITARPGRTVSLNFEPKQARAWRSVAVVVALELCAAGERYIEDAERCEECAPGALKLTNSSAPCDDCNMEGMTCHGGANWTLDDGYWQAANSVERCVAGLPSGSEPPACMFDRVYACATTGACSSPEAQRSSNGGVTIQVEEQCSEGHRSDVALCGACSPGYELLRDGMCRRCAGSAAWRWGTFFGMVGALMALVTLVIRVAILPMWRNSSTLPGVSRVSSVMHRTVARTKRQLFISSLVRMLCNHMQVLAQQTIVFSASVFPGFYGSFASQFTEVITVSLMHWLRVQCLVAGSTSGPTFREATGLGIFYSDFLCLTMLPYLVILPLVVASAPGWLAASQLFLRCRLAEGDDECPRSSTTVEMSAITDLPVDHTASVGWDSSPPPADTNDEPAGIPTKASEAETMPRDDETSGSTNLQSDHLGLKWSATNPTFNTGFEDNCGHGHEGSDALPPQEPKCVSIGEAPEQEGRHKGGHAAALKGSDFMGVYHPFATFVLVFLHPSVSTVCMQLFMCDHIYLEEDEPTAWLRMDLETPCYDLQWFLFMIIAVVVILSYVVGLPLILTFLTNYLYSQKAVKRGEEILYLNAARLRILHCDGSVADEGDEGPMVKYVMEEATGDVVEVDPVFPAEYDVGDGIDKMKTRLLHDRRFRFLSSYVLPYREQCYYWAGCDILIRLSQTSFVVLVEMVSPKYDLLYSIINSTLALTLQSYVQPYQSGRCNFVLALSQLCISLAICSFIGEEYVNEGENNADSVFFGAMLVSYQGIFAAVICYIIVLEVSDYFTKEYDAFMPLASRTIKKRVIYNTVVGYGEDAVKKVEDLAKFVNVRDAAISADLCNNLRRVDNLDIAGHHVCERLPLAELDTRKRDALAIISARFKVHMATDDLLMALIVCVMRDWLCDRSATRVKRTPLLCFRSLRVMRVLAKGSMLLYKGEIDGGSARALHSMATCRADGHDEDTAMVADGDTPVPRPSSATNEQVVGAVKRYIACVMTAKSDALMRADRWPDVQNLFGLRVSNAYTRLAWFPRDEDISTLL